jgi:hypothetical protein
VNHIRLRTAGALALAAASSAIAQATNDLPALLPPYAELPPGFWEQHGATVTLTGGALLAILGVAMWLIVRPRPLPVVPPDVEARRSLEALRDKPESGELVSQASQILKRYLVCAFADAQMEMTTTEILQFAQSEPRIPPALRSKLADFLNRCDDFKFGGTVRPGEIQAAATALALVNQLAAGSAMSATLRPAAP